MTSPIIRRAANWVAGIGGACFVCSVPIGLVLQISGVNGALGVSEVFCVLGGLVGFLASHFFVRRH